MLKLENTNNPHTLRIVFTSMDSLGSLGPYFDVLRFYASETGLKVGVVDDFFNYKFIEDGYKIQFYWNGIESVYIFYIAKCQYDLIYKRLKKICADINRELANRKYFEKHGELPNHGEGFR